MNKFKIVSLTASMLLAMAFAFSCSSNNSTEWAVQSSSSEWAVQSSSSEEMAQSSSSEWVAQSSSSEEAAQSSSSETSSVSLCAGEEYDPDIFRCEYGELIGKCAGIDFYPAYQICEGGVIKNKNEPSSSSGPSQFSSSSSELPPLSSSSSILSSSSSVVPSSNSTVVSSSSSMPDSSSSACTAADNTETHYCSNGTMKEYGFVDYGDQRYKTVEIGEQVWFAENLNYNASGSKCYNDTSTNCDKYGRLYNRATARMVCPSGWHLPSKAEWDTLSSYVQSNSGCSSCDAAKLKATSGWNSCGSVNGNGTDQYGFSALPGGRNSSVTGNFFNVGDHSYWWSSSAYDSYNAYSRTMHCSYEYADWYGYSEYSLYSVRCVQG